ncbi:MAG: trypsin-like peptidase domain-containing protein [Candidatus Aenigmarchaeota archaeon]|nr:trypsin-like peptidase domain-containing protein [Candidatus Aenigmarchaeota archaeon]
MSEKIVLGIVLILTVAIGAIGYYQYISFENIRTTQAAQYQSFQQSLQKTQDELHGNIDSLDKLLQNEIHKTAVLEQELTGKVSTVEQAVNLTRKENERSLNVLSSQLEKVEQTSTEKISTLEEQLKNVRITNKDFSAIIKDVIKTVVSVKTDKGIGSGVIIDSRGYVLTNFHVISGAAKAAIITYDKQAHPVKLIGTHEATDLAVIQIAEEGSYSALDFETRDARIEVGAKVVAVGNPGGLEFSVTEGIISNAERTINDVAYIQHDVPINPGNSGGPLVNIQGNIVGINTQKREGFEGVGFAIHAKVAEAISREIILQATQ